MIPETLSTFLRDIRSTTRPAYQELPEELASKQATFDVDPKDSDFAAVELEDHVARSIYVPENRHPIKFGAFLDGVQRTLPFREIVLPNGALVPVHLAQVAAAVAQNRAGRLLVDPRYFVNRVLLLFPYEGVKQHLEHFPKPEGVVPDTSQEIFDVNGPDVIFCDTTYSGIDESQRSLNSALLGKELFDTAKIRSRAQGRVAVMRQILELLLLAKFRNIHREEWVVFDGPLFFLDKWRGKWNRYNEMSEDDTCVRTVGLIKTLRKRPRNPALVLNLHENERSPVTFLEWEVDLKGGGYSPDERGAYSKRHLCWFTRFRCPTGGVRVPSQEGLIRIDLHASTLGVTRTDAPELSPSGFASIKHKVDEITGGIWNERWPGLGYGSGLRAFSQSYAIDQLERVLHSAMLSRRAMSYVGEVSTGKPY